MSAAAANPASGSRVQDLNSYESTIASHSGIVLPCWRKQPLSQTTARLSFQDKKQLLLIGRSSCGPVSIRLRLAGFVTFPACNLRSFSVAGSFFCSRKQCRRRTDLPRCKASSRMPAALAFLRRQSPSPIRRVASISMPRPMGKGASTSVCCLPAVMTSARPHRAWHRDGSHATDR